MRRGAAGGEGTPNLLRTQDPPPPSDPKNPPTPLHSDYGTPYILGTPPTESRAPLNVRTPPPSPHLTLALFAPCPSPSLLSVSSPAHD